MVIPGALGAEDRQRKVSIHSLHRNVKAIDLVRGSVRVGHGVQRRLQPVRLMRGGIGGSAGVQIYDLLGLQADMENHLSVRHRQRTHPLAGFISVEHAAVGLELGGIHTIRQGSRRCCLGYIGRFGGSSALALCGDGAFRRGGCAAACQQQGRQRQDQELFLHLSFLIYFLCFLRYGNRNRTLHPKTARRQILRAEVANQPFSVSIAALVCATYRA